MTDGGTGQLQHYWWQRQGAILSLKPARHWKQKRAVRVSLLKIETKISEDNSRKREVLVGTVSRTTKGKSSEHIFKYNLHYNKNCSLILRLVKN